MPKTSIHISTEDLNNEENFSNIGVKISSIKKVSKILIFTIRTTIKRIKSVIISIARSTITDPKSLCTGILSVLFNEPHLIISPIRGKATFVR